MNAIAETIPVAPSLIRRIAERHVYVFTAALFVALALAGFVPSSLDKIEAVQAGQRPPFPLALHVHAVLMGAWLLMLLVQSALAATGRRAVHRTLGMAGALLLPGIVVSGFVLIAVTWNELWSPVAAAAMPPEVLAQTRTFVSNILLMQVRALITFPVFIAWALWLRRQDPQSHQRLMFLGTAIVLVAALDRLSSAIGWTTVPASPLSMDLYMLASVLPLLVWDRLHRRQMHRTTRVWLAVNLPLVVAVNLLWNSDWWLAAAPRLMGVV
jgi:hypothetical protein